MEHAIANEEQLIKTYKELKTIIAQGLTYSNKSVNTTIF